MLRKGKHFQQEMLLNTINRHHEFVIVTHIHKIVTAIYENRFIYI